MRFSENSALLSPAKGSLLRWFWSSRTQVGPWHPERGAAIVVLLG